MATDVDYDGLMFVCSCSVTTTSIASVSVKKMKAPPVSIAGLLYYPGIRRAGDGMAFGKTRREGGSGRPWDAVWCHLRSIEGEIDALYHLPLPTLMYSLVFIHWLWLWRRLKTGLCVCWGKVEHPKLQENLDWNTILGLGAICRPGAADCSQLAVLDLVAASKLRVSKVEMQKEETRLSKNDPLGKLYAYYTRLLKSYSKRSNTL